MIRHISLAVRSMNRFGLKNKDIVYEWDQPADQKTKKYYTEGEISQKQKILHKRRMREDFRIHLFDLKKQKETVKPVEDEIFGFEIPCMKKFDTATIAEIYRTEKSIDADEFIKNKLAYLPEYIPPFGQIDPKTEETISEIRKLANSLESTNNIEDEYLLREKMFEDEGLKSMMHELKLLVSEINYKYLPSLICKICFDLKYNDEYIKGLGLYRIIDDKINKHIHLYSIDELAHIYFGLTYKMPKRCSLKLRQNIRDKIVANNFSVLAPEQVMKIYTAFRNDHNCQKVHLKCIEYFFEQRIKVEKESSNDPNLSIKVLYTYMNSRPSERYRRALLEEQEIENETDKMVDIYMPIVLDNIKYLDKNNFLRLLSVTYTLKLKDYEELYIELENFFLNHIEKFDNNEKTLVLYYMARCNNDRGICSRDFWNAIVNKYLGSVIPTNNLQISAFCRLIYALTVSKSIDSASFEKIFGQHLLSFLSSESLSYSEASMLAVSLIILEKQDTNLDKYFKSFIKNISLKDKWVPLRYYYHLKLFTTYCALVHPNWNISYMENLFYHAEKKFNTYHTRKDYITPDYKDLSSLISRLDTYLLSFMDYKNLFLIDYCMEERKLAIMYLTDRDYLFDLNDDERIMNPLTEIKLKILEKDDFVVCSIDHEEFMSIETNKSDWLKQKLENAYVYTEQRAREIHFANQKAVLERNLTLAKAQFKDNRYLDLKTKLEIFEEQQIQAIEDLENMNK